MSSTPCGSRDPPGYHSSLNGSSNIEKILVELPLSEPVIILGRPCSVLSNSILESY